MEDRWSIRDENTEAREGQKKELVLAVESSTN